MPGQESQRYELIDELAEDFAARYRRGEHPSLQEYIDRYPDLADDIRELLPALAEVEQVKEDLVTSVVSAPAPALPMDQIGDFRIVREVGKGGMGVVYEAEQVSLARRVALKLLPKKLLPDAKAKRRFEREAKTAAKLHHTNIVPVFGVGEHDDLPYFVMQFIQGLGLDDVLDEVKRLQGNSSQAPSAGRQACPVPSANDLTAADAARSLLTGVFQAVDAATESSPKSDGTPAYREASLPKNAGSETPVPRPALVTSLSPADSAAHSSSSVTLPGQNSGTGSRQAKALNYWQSVARIGIQVAEALEYAHNQGVLHRDIKPSNLLLDARGDVWVTDFGLAKANDQQNLTDTGDILGTIRYMPPEAFDGKTDARSDVYALGLTLYELLALRPAFGENDRRRLIKEVTTAEPARLNKLNRSIPRDMATMVHKAIDREPAHRYQTAGDFAADLQRFLDDEPIRARRITVRERAWRWCRRNPAVAGLMTAVFLLLATVAGVTSVAAFHFDAARIQEQNLRQAAVTAFAHEQEQRLHAEKARSVAETARQNEADQRRQAEHARSDAVTAQKNEAEQRRQAVVARGEAEQQKQQADANFRQARAAVDDYLTRVSENRLLSVPGMQPLRRELLQSALQYYKEFLKERGQDPALRKDLAAAYLRMAKITADIGSPAEALTLCDKSREVLRDLKGQYPGSDEVRLNLVSCHQLAGRLHDRLGKLDAALQCSQEAYRALLEVSPQNLNTTKRVRRISGAVSFPVPVHSSTDPEILLRFFSVLNDIAMVYRQMGELGPALYWSDQALLIQQSLVDRHSSHPRIVPFRRGLAGQWDRQGLLQAELGMYTEARACHQEAQSILAGLLNEYPSDEHTADFQRDLAASREHEGEVLAKTGELGPAWDCYASASPLRQRLARDNPAVTDFQSDLAQCHFQMGVLKMRAKQPGAALISFQQAIERQRLLVDAMPEIKPYARMLSRQLGWQGAVLRQTGNTATATASYQEARKLLETLPPTQAGDFYELALWRAACDPEPAPALEALGQAIQAGYRDIDRLQTDIELAPLRPRPEFQKLLEGVHSKTKTLRWLDDLDAGRATAAAENKDLFIWLGASDWAPLDAIFRKTRFVRPEFIDYAAQHFVMVDLDQPKYKPQPKHVNKTLGIMGKWGIGGYPHGVLVDAQGRPYGMLGADRTGTRSMKEFLQEMDRLRQARTQRDKLLAQATASKGVAKARLLDRALSTVPWCFLLDYASVIQAIHALDRDNQAGLRSKYENMPWVYRQTLTSEYIDLHEKMLVANPKSLKLRTDLGVCYFYTGALLRNLGKFEEAQKDTERSVALRESIIQDDPNNSQHQVGLGRTLASLGDIHWKVGRRDAGVKTWQRAVDLLAKAHKKNDGDDDWRTELAALHRMIGTAYARANLWEEAEAALDSAFAVQPDYANGFAWLGRASLAMQLGKTDRFRQICQEFARLPTSATHRHWITRLNMLGPGAYTDPALAIKTAQQEYSASPISWYQFVLGAALYRAGKYQESEGIIVKSMEAKAGATYFCHRWFWLAMACKRQGKDEEATQWLQKGGQWMQQNKLRQLPGGGPDNSRWEQSLELRLLRREAELLVTGKATEPR